MGAIQELGRDHQVVLPKLEAMGRQARTLQAGAAYAPGGAVEEFLVAWRAEIEKHFRQEEEGLFPVLERAIGPGGPIRVMLEEHEILRDAVRRLSNEVEAGEPEARRVAKLAETIVRVLTQHIYKEDGVLFPLAEDRLDEAQKEEVDRLVAQVQ